MRKKEKKELAVEQEVLKILSMNARASFNFIGKRIGLSAPQAYRVVKKLEKKYWIKYLAEIDVEKLGFIKFMVLAKFLDNAPTEKEIKEVYDKEPKIQLAMLLAGKSYDLLFYALVRDNAEINALRIELTRNTVLGKYRVLWYVTPFYENYNFVPLRDEFIDTLKERILSRKIERGYSIVKEKQQTMLKREFAILKEWNVDGSMDLRDIDRKYGFEKGRAQYAYYRLLQSELIKRVTINMTNLPIKYIAMFSIRVINYSEFYRVRKRFLLDVISEPELPTNRYVLIGDIGSPLSILLFIPAYTDSDIMERNNVFSKLKETEVSLHTITKTFGRLCFRRLDNTHAVQTDNLVKEGVISQPEKVDYFKESKVVNSLNLK